MDCEISAVLTNANQITPLAKLEENKFRIDSKSWSQTHIWQHRISCMSPQPSIQMIVN